MKLNKINIKNFRSIEEMELILEPRCQIFVGINESGKSNILKAISLLSQDIELDIDDSRILGANEEQAQGKRIKFREFFVARRCLSLPDFFCSLSRLSDALPGTGSSWRCAV